MKGTAVDWKLFALGYVGLFVGLTALVDISPDTAPLASALALSIAGGATAIFLPDVIETARGLAK